MADAGQRKLCLVFVDSLRTDKLEETVAEGKAPYFGALLARGELIPDCVSAFPSVTPVCTSEIATGATPDRHFISGMNWFHRVERRYVEYGSSFEATRAFGLFRATYDIVYNMNMAHLSPEVETFFESLGDAGVRTACTPFLIYRGRTRHELGLDGLLRRGAVAAGFRHAVYGPNEFFYGELFGSRPVPCKPTLARPGTRDDYTACVSKELVADDAYDFLLFSLPDNDYHSHRFGPDAMPASIAHADECFGELVEACGGIDEFLASHAVILMSDHGQTDVEHPYEIAAELGKEWRVLQPSSDAPETAELAVSPTARAAQVYVLVDEHRRAACHADVRARLRDMTGTDIVAWLARADGSAIVRQDAGSPAAGDERVEAVVERGRPRASIPARRPLARPARSALAPDRRPRRARAGAARRRADQRRVPGRPRPALVGADRAPCRRRPRLAEGGLGVRRLGRHLARGRRQPRLAARRRLAVPAAARRSRPGHRAAARPVAPLRRGRAGPRPLRPRRRPAGNGLPRPQAPWGRGVSDDAAQAERPSAGDVARRVGRGTRKPENWAQLFRFGLVGGSGYVVNLIAFALLTELADLHHIPAAIGAFLVAVTNNFVWNRLWTFRAEAPGRHPAHQGARFMIVSLIGLGVNLVVLEALVSGVDLSELPAQAIAVAVAMPVNFVGNKLWTFG